MKRRLPPQELASLRGRNTLDNIYPAIAKTAERLALANIEPDEDGNVRRIQMLWRFPTHPSRTLSSPRKAARSREPIPACPSRRLFSSSGDDRTNSSTSRADGRSGRPVADLERRRRHSANIRAGTDLGDVRGIAHASCGRRERAQDARRRRHGLRRHHLPQARGRNVRGRPRLSGQPRPSDGAGPASAGRGHHLVGGRSPPMDRPRPFPISWPSAERKTDSVSPPSSLQGISNTRRAWKSMSIATR